VPSPSRRVWASALVAAHVAVAWVVWQKLGQGGLSPQLGSDAAGYRSLAVAAGRPYRDFNAAYPPLALAFFELMRPASIDTFVRHLILCNIGLQAGVTWLCFRGWGPRAGWSYLALSLPLMPMLYFRYDLLGVAFALLGLYLLTRGRPVGAAASWVTGAFVKVWPAVLMPSLLAHRKPRAFLAGVGLACAGLLAWVAWGGTGGPGQVLTYGGARGWQFESMPASWLRLFTRGALRYEEGAMRVGAPPRVLGLLLTAALVTAVVATWWYVWRYGARAGVAEVVVVGSGLALGTLLSPQFMIWVVPFVAIAAAAGAPSIERWAAAAVVLTFLDWMLLDPAHMDALGLELVIAARNVVLVAMVVVAAKELLRRVPAATMEAWSPDPSPAASPTLPARTSSSMHKDG
jgi:hypothetical protein